MFSCKLAPSRYEEACERTESYRTVFGDSAFAFVDRIRNPAMYLTTYTGSTAVVVVVVLLDRRKALREQCT